MSESYLTMDTDLLKQDINTFHIQMETFCQEMEAMRGEINQITSMWEEPASQSFVAQMAKDYQRMAAICREIEGFLHCMEEAYKAFIGCENEIADAIASLRL